MEKDALRDAVMEAVEASLAAQLRAVRQLRNVPGTPRARTKKGMSQIDMAYAILEDEGAPLHVTRIIEAIGRRFDVQVDRESLVSALTKKVARQERFERAGKNTFAIKKERAR